MPDCMFHLAAHFSNFILLPFTQNLALKYYLVLIIFKEVHVPFRERKPSLQITHNVEQMRNPEEEHVCFTRFSGSFQTAHVSFQKVKINTGIIRESFITQMFIILLSYLYDLSN